MLKRTHNCNDLRKEHVGQEVILTGWAQKRRDHGGVIFIDLRDHTGIIQLVVTPETVESFKLAESVRDEFSLRGFPTPLFWMMQILMQTGVFAVGQLYGQYLLSVWG